MVAYDLQKHTFHMPLAIHRCKILRYLLLFNLSRFTMEYQYGLNNSITVCGRWREARNGACLRGQKVSQLDATLVYDRPIDFEWITTRLIQSF